MLPYCESVPLPVGFPPQARKALCQNETGALKSMPVPSRTSFNIIAIVAFLTIMGTAMGVWHASRQTMPTWPEETTESSGNPFAPEAPNTQFSSPTEARNTLARLLKAAQRGKPEDYEFLTGRFEDFRLLPAPEDEKKDEQKKDDKSKKPEPSSDLNAHPGEPDSIPKTDLAPPTKWVTVSEVAQDLLIATAPASLDAVYAKLREIKRRHPPDRPDWTESELNLLQASIHTLGRYQGKQRQARQQTTDPPPTVLTGSTSAEFNSKLDPAPLLAKSQEHTRSLGLVWITDKRITVPSYRPTKAHPPHFDVKPDNLQTVIEALTAATALSSTPFRATTEKSLEKSQTDQTP